MAISAGGGGAERPMSDINTTPLVDVMLVLLIIFLITVPVAIQSVQKLKIPVLPADGYQDKVENVLLSVTTTDDAGISPGEPGYAGPSRNGACRVYFNNVQPVDSTELREQSVARMDSIIKKNGGLQNMTPENTPEVHIRADQNVPWKCVAGTIYQMQAAGYPRVGFISNKTNPDGG